MIEVFRDLPPTGVEITLYGATPETYESVTGVPGSYERCMSGIERLREAGIRLGLKTVLMVPNRHELHQIGHMAKTLGDKKFRFDIEIQGAFGQDSKPLEVRLDPATAGLTATDRIRFGGDGEAGEGLDFLLHEGLEIRSARLGDETLEVKALRRWRPRDFYASPDYSELGTFKIARQHQIVAPAGGWPAEPFEVTLEFAGAAFDHGAEHVVKRLAGRLAAGLRGQPHDGVADRPEGIESRGFLFAAPVALELGLPFVPGEILDEERAWDTRVLIHCFTHDWPFAREVLERGAYLSVPGVATYKNARVM
mgnify:CR=1 FL=1